MTQEERKKVAELERDIRKMQRDHKKEFAEFEKKKSLWARLTDRIKALKQNSR